MHKKVKYLVLELIEGVIQLFSRARS